MEKITLASIKAWMDAQLAETQDAEERDEVVGKAKLQAFYLGALDKYARVTKQPQAELKMKVYTMILKYDDAVLGRVYSDLGLTPDEALDLLGIDMDKYAEEQGWDGWDYEQLSLELEEDKKVAYTDYETYMASDKARVVWSGEYAGFDFSIFDYGEDAGKPGRCYRFTEICFDKDGVERGWCDIDEDGYEGMIHEGFPFSEGFELPEGMTEDGLDAFFQAQPKEEAFRALWED